MSKPIIHDGNQQREMTDVEYAEWQALCVDIQSQVAARESAAAAKVSAHTKLKVLGLTDDEIAALVG